MGQKLLIIGNRASVPRSINLAKLPHVEAARLYCNSADTPIVDQLAQSNLVLIDMELPNLRRLIPQLAAAVMKRRELTVICIVSNHATPLELAHLPQGQIGWVNESLLRMTNPHAIADEYKRLSELVLA